MSRRAEALADRIEQGAAGLAAFAEGLSQSGMAHNRRRHGCNRGPRGKPSRR
jgi:hypothetical protein